MKKLNVVEKDQDKHITSKGHFLHLNNLSSVFQSTYGFVAELL
jgi:hypothetical protein